MSKIISPYTLSKVSESNHRTIYTNIKHLIRMYDSHPELLDRLVEQMK